MMSHTSLPDGEGSANKQLINTLLHSRIFRDYANVFTKATGLALALRPLEDMAARTSPEDERKSFLRSARGAAGDAGCLFAIAFGDYPPHWRHPTDRNVPVRFDPDSSPSATW